MAKAKGKTTTKKLTRPGRPDGYRVSPIATGSGYNDPRPREPITRPGNPDGMRISPAPRRVPPAPQARPVPPASGGMGLPAMTNFAAPPAAPPKPSLPSISQQLSGPNPYMPTYGMTPEEQARGNVNLEFDPISRALQQALEESRRSTRRNSNIERNYGREADRRVGDIYTQLNELLGRGQANTQDIYADSLSDIRGFYDEARQQNETTNNDIIARLQQGAQGLGIEAALPDATSGINSDLAFFQQQNANNKARGSANISTLGANMLGIGQQAIGSAAREGAQQRGNIAQEVARALGQIGVTGQESERDFLNQQVGVETDRAGSLRQELERIKQSRSEAERQARLDQLAEKLQLNTADLQRMQMERGIYESDRDFGFQKEQTGFQNMIQLQQLDMQKREFEATLQGSTDPIERAMALAQLEKITAETDRLRATTPGGSNGMVADLGKTYGTNENGLQNWMNSPNAGNWDSDSQNWLRNLLSTADQKVQEHQREYGEKIDPYQLALQRVNSASGEWANLFAQNPGWRNMFRQALQVYYGK